MTTGPMPPLLPVGELPRRPVVAVAPDTSIVEAARAMRDHDVGCLAVAGPRPGSGRRPMVVTDRDVAMAVAAGRDLDAPVRTIIGAAPLVLPADAGALDAAMALLRTGVRYVIVTDDGHVAGIVSADDVMATLAEAVVPERLFLVADRRHRSANRPRGVEHV